MKYQKLTNYKPPRSKRKTPAKSNRQIRPFAIGAQARVLSEYYNSTSATRGAIVKIIGYRYEECPPSLVHCQTYDGHERSYEHHWLEAI